MRRKIFVVSTLLIFPFENAFSNQSKKTELNLYKQNQQVTQFDESEKPIGPKNTLRCEIPTSPDKLTLCSSTELENTHQFINPMAIENAKQLDLRPADCGSFFDDYMHTRRGASIETALGSTEPFNQLIATSRTFPVVDYFNDTEAHMVTSRDLTADSYLSTNGSKPLYDQLISDAERVQTAFVNRMAKDGLITANDGKKTTEMYKNKNRTIYIDVVVQADMASDSQIAQIKLATTEIMKRFGFKLQIIEIP